MTTYKAYYTSTSSSNWDTSSTVDDSTTYVAMNLGYLKNKKAPKKMPTKKTYSTKQINFEEQLKKVENHEVTKLLRSIGEFPEGVDTPVIVVIKNDAANSLKFIGEAAICQKYPSVTKLAVMREGDIKDIDGQKRLIHKIFPLKNLSEIVIPIVVMLDLFSKDQNKVEQALLMKRGADLIEAAKEVFGGKTVKVNPEPLIIINESLKSEDIEEAALVAGVSEIEEVKEDDLSYFKLTF